MSLTPWLTARLSPRVLRRLAAASVLANVLIVVTGGAVRLTSSGLGCPTWPRCDSNSLVPTAQDSLHGVIEFTNRMLTFALTVVVLATLVAAIVHRQQIRWAALLVAGIPAQAVLGGITVLTHLNPWAVASHFLLSMALLAVAFTLWWRIRQAQSGDVIRTPPAPPACRRAAAAVTTLTLAVLCIGTVVTGSGPHAGVSGTTARIQIRPSSITQLHADSVMVLVGLTVGLVLLVNTAGGSPLLSRACRWLLGLELAQGLIGFVQYFTGVPAVLVGLHQLGACLVWLAALWVQAQAGSPLRRPVSVPGNRRADRPSPAVIGL